MKSNSKYLLLEKLSPKTCAFISDAGELVAVLSFVKEKPKPEILTKIIISILEEIKSIDEREAEEKALHENIQSIEDIGREDMRRPVSELTRKDFDELIKEEQEWAKN